MVIVAESASCAEKNATAIAMANTITQAEQHVSQDLVDLNAVDPQQQQAGCVTSDAPPDQPAVDVAVGTTKAASALSASLSKRVITRANSASCAAENATAIDKVNASTLRHYARGVAGTVRAKALQSAACTPAMMLVNVAIVHASGASPKAASSLSLSCAVNTNTVNAAQSTSCAARKAAAIDTVATTNAESAAEDGNKLVGIPTSNGGNNAHGTRPSAIQLQTAKAAAQVTVASLFSIPKGKVGTEWKVLMRKDAATLMKGAVAECNKGAAAEHNSISGTIALLLHIPPETVESIIGRWSSYTSIGYQRYKAEVYPMKKGNQ